MPSRRAPVMVSIFFSLLFWLSINLDIVVYFVRLIYKETLSGRPGGYPDDDLIKNFF